MKDKSVIHKANRVTQPMDGSPATLLPMDTYFDVVNTTPNLGDNTGDFMNPTAWAYTVDVYRRFCGQKIVYDPYTPGKIDKYITGPIGNYVKTDVVPYNAAVKSMLWNRTLGKINSRVMDESNWSEDLAQADKTRKLGRLCDQAEKLADWEKRKWQRQSIAKASGLFLNFKYGWGPLVQNIYDTALQQLNSVEKHGIVIKAGSSQKMNFSGRIVNTAVGSTDPIVYHDQEGRASCRMKIWLKGREGMDISSYTTLNPFYLGWNLIPYSFVVDWFYDVGGYLHAAEQRMKWNPLFYKGYASELFYMEAKEYASGFYTDPSKLYLTTHIAGYHRKVEFKRTVFSSWPFPRMPRIEIDLGGSRLLAAAALLGTIFR